MDLNNIMGLNPNRKTSGNYNGGVNGTGNSAPQISSLNLNKNQSVVLSSLNMDKPIREIVLPLGWATRPGVDIDLDASAIALEEVKDPYGNISYKVLDPHSEVVFYGQPKVSIGMEYGGDSRSGHRIDEHSEDKADETIKVDLTMIPDKIKKIVFVVTINDALALQQNFGLVDSAFIRVDDMTTGTPKELCKYILNENFKLETAVTIAQLFKNDRNLWEVKALGEGHFNKTLAHILYEYGVR